MMRWFGTQAENTLRRTSHLNLRILLGPSWNASMVTRMIAPASVQNIGVETDIPPPEGR